MLYVSSTSNGTVGGVSFADEDILAYDTGSGAWSMFFDGSDVGVTGDVNAFALLADGSILMSFDNTTSAGAAGTVDDSDIVRFFPSSTGTNTAGTFTLHFDGSDVGLTTSGEDIDALEVLPDGRLLISTTGNPGVPGVSGVADEDLLAFTPSSLGVNTSGSWAMYFDGSDVGLSNASSEDTNGVNVGLNGDIYLTTIGAFSVSGASGTGSDVFVCNPISLGTTTSCSFSFYWNGAAFGFGSEVMDGLAIVE